MANTLALLLGADRGRLKVVPTKQVEVKRLTEALGEQVLFTVRALSGEEYQDVLDMTMTGKGKDKDFDFNTSQMMTLLNGIVDPDLKNKDLIAMYGAKTPEDLIMRSDFLLPGERMALYTAIQELSGFNDEAVTEVKN
jgi:hypothetical protein